MNKYLKIGGIVASSAIILVLVAAFGFKYAVNSGKLTYWDGKWYTKYQLEKAFPPQYVDVPAKNTPEEVYAAFREALINGRIDDALKNMSDYRKKEYVEAFKDEVKYKKWAETLPEKIEKQSINGNYASYYYFNFKDKNDKSHHIIDLIKNSDGFWLIEQI